MPYLARLFAPVALLVACSQPAPPPASPSGPESRFTVRTYGSVQTILDRGQTGAAVALAPLLADKHLVGIGWLASLRGEVTIFDGRAWLATPKNDGGFRTDELGTHQDSAAFLVVASVPRWQPIPLPEDTRFADLGSAVKDLARGAGLDVSQPLPFMIDGALGNLSLSVVNGGAFAGEPRITEEALTAASPKAKVASGQGTVVGFHAEGEHPEFLRSGTSVHLHVVETSTGQSGHVEHLDLPRGTNFRFPLPNP